MNVKVFAAIVLLATVQSRPPNVTTKEPRPAVELNLPDLMAFRKEWSKLLGSMNNTQPRQTELAEWIPSASPPSSGRIRSMTDILKFLLSVTTILAVQ